MFLHYRIYDGREFYLPQRHEVTKKKFLIYFCPQIFFLLLIPIQSVSAQNNFVHVNGTKFYLDARRFSFLGFNAYYLQSAAADSATRYIVDDVFKAAGSVGFNVIRIWAFYESSDITPAVIRYSPYGYNESGLSALDYVLSKAKQYNVKLILTLANNYSPFGGIPQYTAWANKYLTKSDNSPFTHNDFFTNDSIKTWYKNYLELILDRTNIYTSVKYKDDPSIFSFELMNEAVNPGQSSSVIKSWYKEMAGFFKSIDHNHLLATGEEGYDVPGYSYSNADLFYNSSYFLFNGSKGTSYVENSSLPDIDYTTFHLYSGQWNISYPAGETWIRDHIKISQTLNKPALLGEFGSTENKASVYNNWLDVIENSDTRSAVVWQYLHPDVKNNDGFGFNLSDAALISEFKDFIKIINEPQTLPQTANNVELYQNYPNPFNPVTTIKYSLSQNEFVNMELYTVLGKKIGTLVNGYQTAGVHEITLSFNSNKYSSGIYIYTLRTPDSFACRKLMVLK